MQSGKRAEMRQPEENDDIGYRGRGGAGFVIAVNTRKTDVRFVWKFKNSTTDLSAQSAYAHTAFTFIRDKCIELIGEEYVPDTELVQLNRDCVKYLLKIEHYINQWYVGRRMLWEDWKRIYHKEVEHKHPFEHQAGSEPELVAVLQMADVTRLPLKQVPKIRNDQSTLAVEIKPKFPVMASEWFKHSEKAIAPPPFCVNCIQQMHWVKQGKFDDDYHFCPMELFSGDSTRMSRTILELLKQPHNHLKIFRDSVMIRTNGIGSHASITDHINDVLGVTPEKFAKYVSLIASLFAGYDHCCDFNELLPDSIAVRLLKAQSLDRIGLIQAHRLYTQLKTKGHLSAQQRSDLDDFVTSGTFKDCSVMFTIHRIVYFEEHYLFNFAISVIDLDKKSVGKIDANYKRFMTACKEAKRRTLRLPCNEKN